MLVQNQKAQRSDLPLFLVCLLFSLHLANVSRQIVPLLLIDLRPMSFSHIVTRIFHLICLLCIEDDPLLLLLFRLEFFFALLCPCFELFPLVLVLVGDTLNIDVCASDEISHWSSQYLLDSRQTKEAERVGHLPNVQNIESENEL